MSQFRISAVSSFSLCQFFVSFSFYLTVEYDFYGVFWFLLLEHLIMLCRKNLLGRIAVQVHCRIILWRFPLDIIVKCHLVSLPSKYAFILSDRLNQRRLLA